MTGSRAHINARKRGRVRIRKIVGLRVTDRGPQGKPRAGVGVRMSPVNIASISPAAGEFNTTLKSKVPPGGNSTPSTSSKA